MVETNDDGTDNRTATLTNLDRTATLTDLDRTATLTDLDRTATETSRALRRGTRTALRQGALEDRGVTPDGGTDPTSLDVVFEALAHPYRRRILLLVAERNPRDENEVKVAVEDLATEDDDLELLTVELYHTHLPKLAEAGYVEWDEEGHTIRRGPNFETISPLIRLMDDHRDELPGGWP